MKPETNYLFKTYFLRPMKQYMMERELPDYFLSIICYLNYATFVLEFS